MIEYFVDTAGDNLVQPLDALRVLNHLARRSLPAGEGEAATWAGSSSATEAAQRRDRDASDVALQQ